MNKNALETQTNRQDGFWTTPFRELTKMQEDFDRAIHSFWEPKVPMTARFKFSPSCEIKETKENYLLKFDMPGIQKDQLKIELDKSILTVSAERKEEKKSEGEKTYSSEIYYGSYTRSFTLPPAVDEKKIDAKFENGVLTVTIPKTETSEAKRIAVQ